VEMVSKIMAQAPRQNESGREERGRGDEGRAL